MIAQLRFCLDAEGCSTELVAERDPKSMLDSGGLISDLKKALADAKPQLRG